MALTELISRCRATFLACVVAAAFGATGPASALPITWNFTGVFDDGGTASGQFTLNVYGYLTDGSFITTTDGTLLTGVAYSRPPNPTSILPNPPPAFGVAFYSANYNRSLWLNFDNSLEIPGINPLDLNHTASFECLAWSCPGPGIPATNANTRFFVSGTASAVGYETPIPGALPLFATGIGALGLLAWRRRKRMTPSV